MYVTVKLLSNPSFGPFDAILPAEFGSPYPNDIFTNPGNRCKRKATQGDLFPYDFRCYCMPQWGVHTKSTTSWE